MVRCPVCLEQNQDQFRFCSSCGNPMPTTSNEIRKTVTIMFVDVAGSTHLAENIDSEPLQQLMTRYFATVRELVYAHGGSVEKFIGDAVFGVFGIPAVHEDDALRAVRAALATRAAMRELSDDLRRDWGLPLRIRIGINTGEVTVAGGRVTGDAVNVAQRLEASAAPDDIVIGDDTYRLIRANVTVDTVDQLVVQGKRAPLRAHRLRALVDPGHGGRAPSPSPAPVIGRNRERRRIQDAFEAVVEERICHLFTVLGPAGIGKSRMVKEFCDGVSNRATVLWGRCLSYGEGIAYWPLMEMVRQATGVSADSPALEGRNRLRELLVDELGVAGATEVVAALAPLVGLGGAEVGTQESFWAVRSFFQALAERRPLVLCFDDVHWAEPTLLDLIEHITDWSRDAPILLLCLSRPEMLEERRQWGGGKLNATSMLLQPLTEARCQRLIRSLMGSDDLAPELVDRITSSAAGNPLFVEQMVAALVDDGLLRRDGNHWTAASGSLRNVKVPPTISALLAARLDRLDTAERHVLERAAVVGNRFYLDAVVDLSEPEERQDVAAHCLALVRKELVHPDRSDLPGVEAFRFLHVLLRDCAYQATSKRQRSDLHERFARWLQARMLGGPGEHDELVGYHLEQAYRYRVELGQRDAATVELGRQAATCLIEAADRVRQGDEMGAAQLLKRAIVLLPELDPLRLRAEIDLGWALYSFGRLSDAERILRQVTDRARRAGEHGLRAHARLAHLRVLFSTEPDGLVATTLEEAGEALADFVRDGDEVGAALACRSQASAYTAAGQYAAAEKAMEMAVQHAEDSGVPRAAQSLRRELISLLSWTPRPVKDSIAIATAALDGAGDDRGQRRALLAQLAVLTAMTGDIEGARAHLKDAEEIVWDLRGPRFDPMHSGFVVARVALLADDLTTAERELRKSCRYLSQMGERASLATRAAALAEVMLALGRLDEAGKYVTRCSEASATDQLPAQAGWCGVHARLLAIRGRDTEALRFADTAVELAEKADDYDCQATALLARAEVLHRTDRKDDAAMSLADALERYRRKGNIAAAALASRAFDSLEGPATVIMLAPPAV